MIVDSIKKMLFKSKGLVGIDIGSQSIKIAEFKTARSGYRLDKFSIIATPPSCINNGEIMQPITLGESIRSVASEIGLKNKNAATNIWGSAVIVKKITMPAMEKNLIDEQIQWEAEQYIPFDINEICLEYHILNSPSENTETMEVLLVAAKKELVGNYIETISSAGFKCETLDVSSFALANCFEVNYGKTDHCAAILNVGSRITNFVVMKAGEVLFCRDIPIGSFNYTSDIHKELAVSLEEAYTLKMTAIQGQEVPEEVQASIQSTHETIGDEIQGSFDFYMAASSGLSIDKIYLTGGATLVPGFCDNLSSSLNIEHEILDPFLNIQFDEKKNSQAFIDEVRPFAAIALGLAMRNTGDS